MNKHTDAVIEDWEKNAVGKNVHSVYVFCFECRTDGINFPLERKCGNCGSMETTTYYDRETIGILIQQARLDAAREERIRTGKIKKRQYESGVKKGRRDLEKNVGMMRHWLNEDRIKDAERFVTNEELLTWFSLKEKPSPSEKKEEILKEETKKYIKALKEKSSPSEEGCGCHPEAIACNCNNCLHCQKGEA